MRAMLTFTGVLLALSAACAVAAETAPAMAKIPSKEDRAKALATVKEAYKADYAKTDAASRAALAKRLLADGIAEKFDAAIRYCLLLQAAEIAVTGGDAATAVKAAEEMCERFEGLDSYATRVKFYDQAAQAKVGTSAQAVEAANLGVELAYVGIAADRFDLAEQAAASAENAASRSGKVSTLTAVRDKLAKFREIALEYKATLPARETLKIKSGDPAANAALGKFEAFYRGDWVAAIPLLAKGDDAALADLAKKELVDKPDVAASLQIADAWWEYAGGAKGYARASAGRHATVWYRKVLSELSGGTKARVETRIKAGVPGAAETQPAKVDLVALMDAQKDVVAGEWKVVEGAVTCERGEYARMEIPIAPPEEYDLTVTFARAEGDGGISILLAGPNGSAFGFTMDIGRKARIETVNGKASTDNPTIAKFNVENDKKYTALVQVRRDGVKALVDGTLVCEHKSDYKDLGRYKPWRLREDTLLGLGANGGRVTFFKAELVVVSGEYKKSR